MSLPLVCPAPMLRGGPHGGGLGDGHMRSSDFVCFSVKPQNVTGPVPCRPPLPHLTGSGDPWGSPGDTFLALTLSCRCSGQRSPVSELCVSL